MEELHSILECKATAKPVKPDPRAQDKRLRLRYNVTYIVAGVVFERGKVLLIQEAKPECRGEWYLPAGRMERDETIIQAIKREVKEESGLIFEPEALLAVECMSRAWVRVTLSGRITGGSLKTLAEADKESLQAGWFTEKQRAELKLRCTDILSLIEDGRRWTACREKYGGLPVMVGHVSLSLRLIIIHDTSSGLLVLTRVEGQTSTAFPIVDVNGGRIDITVKSCGYKGAYRECGVLSLEHMGGACDGMCVSVLLEATGKELDGKSGYQWRLSQLTMQEKLKKALQNCTHLYHSL